MGRGRLNNYGIDRLTIPYGPMKHQALMHADEARFRLIVGGRRSGKSKSILHETLRHCFEVPQALAWWVSPTYKEAREVGFEEFLEFSDAIKPAIVNLHRGNMRVQFRNGSKMYFKGADRRDSLRGRGLTFLGLDEAAFLAPDIWKKVLRPALADRKGKAVMGTTPNGRNWLYYLWVAIVAGDPNWSKYHWPSQVNPLMTADELEDMAKDMSEMDFRQEVLAEFVTKAGQVFADFDDNNIIDLFKPDPSWEIFVGADFGYANPAAVLFFAVDPTGQKVVQWDEIYRARMTMEVMTTEIHKKLLAAGLGKHNVQAIFTDPAGNAEEITSGISPVDHLRGEDYTVINKGTQIAPGLALVRSYVKNVKGERRLFITRNCKETIRSMQGYTYPSSKSDSILSVDENPLKDGVNDHACDALRYFFVNRFDHAKWITKRIPQHDYHRVQPQVRGGLKRCSECRTSFWSQTPKTQPPFDCPKCTAAAIAQ